MKECRERMSGRGRIAEKEREGEGKRDGKGEGEPHTDYKYITETQRRIHCAHRMYSHRITLERTSLSY